MSISLIIAEDHAVTLHGFAALFQKTRAINLVGQAQDVPAALALIRQHRPDVALLDTCLRDENDGFALARALREKKAPVKIVFMTGQDRSDEVIRELVQEAVRAQELGFILKGCSEAELIESIETVAAGRRYFCGAVSRFMMSGAAGPLESLNVLDCKILLGIANYKTSQGIAEEVGRSKRTVENRRLGIAETLDLKGRHALLKFALEHKSELERKVLPAHD